MLKARRREVPMNNVRPTFRDGIDNFSVSPPRVTNTLECDERNRRADRYVDIVDMLVGLTGKDRDYLNAMTYSELLAFAIGALQAEQAGIR